MPRDVDMIVRLLWMAALALGAKAVGLGRPFLYGNGTYGEEGVRKVISSQSLSPAASSPRARARC